MQDRIERLEEALARAYHCLPETPDTYALLSQIEDLLQEKTSRESASKSQSAAS